MGLTIPFGTDPKHINELIDSKGGYWNDRSTTSGPAVDQAEAIPSLYRTPLLASFAAVQCSGAKLSKTASHWLSIDTTGRTPVSAAKYSRQCPPTHCNQHDLTHTLSLEPVLAGCLSEDVNTYRVWTSLGTLLVVIWGCQSSQCAHSLGEAHRPWSPG